MHKLLLFSDPHLGEMKEEDAAYSGLSACAAHARAHHPDSDHVVFCGDLSDEGTPTGYHTLKSICSTMDAPITYLMGNEDSRDVFSNVFPEVPQQPDGFFQTSLRFANHTVLCLDTLDPTPEPKHSGILCDARLRWLDDQLVQHAGRDITVVMHHPPVPLGVPSMDAIGLRNGAEHCKRLRNSGVRRVITGHVHRTSITEANGLICHTLGSTAFGITYDTRATQITLDKAHCPTYAVLGLTNQGARLHTQTVPRQPA